MNNILEYLLSLKPVTEEYDKSIVREAIMEFAVKEITVEGIVLEFGVGNGASSRRLISRLPKETIVFLFDSFEGLPEDWFSGCKKGAFKQERVPVFLYDYSNVIVVEGLFKDTLPEFATLKDIAFIHIDCDLYSSTKTIFKYMNDEIVPGTILLFDEFYNYPVWKDHEYKAFLEWIERDKREFEYIGRSEREQVVIRITK